MNLKDNGASSTKKPDYLVTNVDRMRRYIPDEKKNTV